MFVLIWSLLFSVRGADSGSSDWITHCQATLIGDFCVSLKEKITAEAGLCVVIPCSFDTPYYFTPTGLVWYKCDLRKGRCSDSDVIFDTSHSSKVQSGFTGRVSLLETRMSQRDCSILINDLQESDSGSYQLRVNGLMGRKTDRFEFSPRATVSVGGLKQKPRLTVPPLTAGQQTSLSCTAPGLCSGSPPDITWTWRGRGEEDFNIIGNSTDSHIENLTDLTQRHSSNLTFTPSAQHHDTNITCKISFTGDITTEETVTLNVTYKREPQIIGTTTVKEGDDLNLTCRAESFPPSVIKWTKHPGSKIYVQNTGSATLFISNVTTEDSGLYICTAEHLDGNVTVSVSVTVMFDYMKQCGGYRGTLPWAVAAASLSVNVFCFICMWLLWNKSKKVKPNEEDRTYMSLHKVDPSPEYDVIVHQQH